MTVKEFFESDKGLVIHCDTEDKAIKLCKEFDRLGYRWHGGNSYFKYNCWDLYKKDTCYSNVWGYGPIYYYQEKCCTILEFEEIEF